MYTRLKEYLDNFKILASNQFGLKKLNSSYMALMTLMDKLITSLEKKNHVIGIFLDFSIVFDTVDHSILLRKLSHYGIRGNSLNWFASYLSGCTQYVTYNGVSSQYKSISCGVPQGSLCSLCKHITPILFADDTNLFCNGADLQEMEKCINDKHKYHNG